MDRLTWLVGFENTQSGRELEAASPSQQLRRRTYASPRDCWSGNIVKRTEMLDRSKEGHTYLVLKGAFDGEAVGGGYLELDGTSTMWREWN